MRARCSLMIGTCLLLAVACTSDPTPQIQAPEVDQSALDEKARYLKRGERLVGDVANAVVRELEGVFTANGASYALSYCNNSISPEADSLANAVNATVQWVSDRYRNIGNKPNARQADFLENAHALQKSGKQVSPVIFDEQSKMTAYYPIAVSEICLNCHGTPHEEVLDETLETIARYYPDDQAIGYAVDDIRGLWVVQMQKD